MSQRSRSTEPSKEKGVSKYFFRQPKDGSQPSPARQTSEKANMADTEQLSSQPTGQFGPDQELLHYIAESIARMENKLDSKVEELKRDQKTKLDEVLEKISGMEKSLNFVHQELSEAKEKSHKLEQENRKLRSELDECKKTTENIESTMNERLNEVERRSREYNIRIHGLIDAKGERNYKALVAKTLVENKLVPENHSVEMTMNDIEIAHPLHLKGQYIARFYSRPCRNYVVKEAKVKLNKKTDKQGLKVYGDLTKLDYERKRRAAPQMRAAYSDGKKATFHRGRLIIDGKTVSINQNDTV